MIPPITIALGNYASRCDKVTVDVTEEAQVHLDLSGLTPDDATAGTVETAAVLHPDEARALAAMLVAHAEAAER